MLSVKLKGLKPLKVSFTIHKHVTKLAIEKGRVEKQNSKSQIRVNDRTEPCLTNHTAPINNIPQKAIDSMQVTVVTSYKDKVKHV